MAGSITTLGVGSNLELQSILEQLKDTEQAPIKAKETKKLNFKKKLEAYNSVNTKLFSMKSKALSLSLESDFLQTKASISDEEVLSAKVDDGIAISSQSVEVIKKAEYSSWQTAGINDTSDIVYAAPDTGISSPGKRAVDQDATMHIKYGSLDDQKSIDVDVKAGMNLTQVLDAINSSVSNQDSEGNPLVKATMEKNGDSFYLRLSAVGDGDSGDAQVSIEPPEVGKPTFDYVASDTAISIKLGKDDKPSFVNVPPGTNYQELSQRINDAQLGVTAKIVDTGMGDSPFRLTITSNDSGEDNRIYLEASSSNFMEEVTGKDKSLNSEFKVNGITYQRSSNKGISDVISGVTLELKKVGESSIGVTKDTAPIKENIMELVEGFNELLSKVQGSKDSSDDSKTEKKDNGDNSNPLADSFEAKTIVSKIRDFITTSIPNVGQGFSGLADLGLEVNKNGTMTLNEEVLDQKLAADPEKVARLFIGDEDQKIKGLGDIINDGLTDMVSVNGLVTTEIDMIETRMEGLTKNIKRSNEMLDKRYKSLTAEFVRLDVFISQTNREAGLMTSMIDSFNKTMEK